MSTIIVGDNTDYKALVCVFFFGGQDNNDTIIPYDQASYDAYVNNRQGIMDSYNYNNVISNRNRANLLPLTPLNAVNFNDREYALTPELSELHTMFNDEELAIVGSVGPLIEPTTRTQFENKSVQLPRLLFSHDSQQNTWLTKQPEGKTTGWGGEVLEEFVADFPALDPKFMGVNAGSRDTFVTGPNEIRSFKASFSGSSQIKPTDVNFYIGTSANYTNAKNAMELLFRRTQIPNVNIFENDTANITGTGVLLGSEFDVAYQNAHNFTVSFPNTGLARQLNTVANTISVRQALNVQRQVFFVGIGDFDTHGGHSASIPPLHEQYSIALKSFRDAMIEIGMWNNVTVFTASDFGRTLVSNGRGTDHGWGNHHFVMGGSINGGRIYGDLPSQDVSSQEYSDSRGRLIPTISVDQYASTLCEWFGLDASEIQSIFPNLTNFSPTNLNFFKP